MANDPLRERFLAIMKLIAHYVTGDGDYGDDAQEIVEKLLDFGFDPEEIDAAMNWVEMPFPEEPVEGPGERPSLGLPTQRVFLPEEEWAISIEARGLLVRLRAMGIIDDETQEEIIERAVQSGEERVSLQEMKVLAALSIMTRPHHEWQREIACILEDDWAQVFH